MKVCKRTQPVGHRCDLGDHTGPCNLVTDDSPLSPPLGEQDWTKAAVEIPTVTIMEADLVRVCGPLGSLIWHGLTRAKPYA